MTKVFVTGSSGFLATNVIVELLSKGYYVVGLLRNIKRFHYKISPSLELVEGDISKPETYKHVLKGCGSVIHVAAITAQNLPRYHQYEKVNVDASKQLLELAVKYSIKKFVYVSTANTLGYGTKDNPGTEETPIKYPFTKSFYALSKLNAQQIVLSYQDKLDVVVVTPTFMLGGYDSKPSSGKIILMGYNKKVIFYPPGGKNFVHVIDVALGCIAALEKGNCGETYLLANENLSYLDFFKKLSKESNTNPLYIKIPKFALLFLGLVGSILRGLGLKTNLSVTNMQAICINNYFINNKARDELEISFQPIEKAILDALAWFKQQKMIK